MPNALIPISLSVHDISSLEKAVFFNIIWANITDIIIIASRLLQHFNHLQIAMVRMQYPCDYYRVQITIEKEKAFITN